jgi:peptidoglycan/LPS O-acetylase OafA/YrhL
MSSPNDSTARVPCLDGLRALSIGLVLSGHLVGTRGFPVIPRWLLPPFFNGSLGVTVFFVISGFLITGLLAREVDQRGGVDFRQFYLRRALRIFPAYYTLLAVVLLLRALGAVSVSGTELLAAFTYTRNFVPQGAWHTGHA